MGQPLKQVVASYRLGESKDGDRLTTSLLASKLRTIITAGYEGDLTFSVSGNPQEFWQKSSPFSAITSVSYYYLGDTSPGFFVEIVCKVGDQNINKDRVQTKWTGLASQLLHISFEQVLITFTEI
jgi:hypothetical protein